MTVRSVQIKDNNPVTPFLIFREESFTSKQKGGQAGKGGLVFSRSSVSTFQGDLDFSLHTISSIFSISVSLPLYYHHKPTPSAATPSPPSPPFLFQLHFLATTPPPVGCLRSQQQRPRTQPPPVAASSQPQLPSFGVAKANRSDLPQDELSVAASSAAFPSAAVFFPAHLLATGFASTSSRTATCFVKRKVRTMVTYSPSPGRTWPARQLQPTKQTGCHDNPLRLEELEQFPDDTPSSAPSHRPVTEGLLVETSRPH